MEFKKRVIITSIISGVLPSSYLVSRYNNLDESKANSSTIKVIGFVLSIMTYSLSIFLVNKFLLQPGSFDSNPSFAYGLSLLLFITIQSIATILFIKTNEKIYGSAIFSSKANMKNGVDKAYFIALFILGLLITTCLFAFGPFLFIFSSIYFIPNVYLHHKIKQVLKTRVQIFTITLLFTLVVLMFPAALFLSKHIETSAVRIITSIGFYYAPLLLYLLLIYVSFDLITLVFRKLKVPVIAKFDEGKYKTAAFLTILTLSILIVANGASNFNTPAINEYKVQVPKRSSSIKQLKVAMAADFHFSEITSLRFVDKFVTKINSLDADIVLFAGDIFESNRSSARLDFIQKELCRIKSKYGVYAVEGNHGYYRQTNSQVFFNETNITLLKDTLITIDNNFQLMGRMDRHNRNRSSISDLLALSNSDLPLITMDHQPYYEDKNFDQIDVYLSGHTHNGQLFPFNLIEKFVYEIPWGYKKINNTHCFVTCGAQGWGPQVRTASQSEIMVINIVLEDN